VGAPARLGVRSLVTAHHKGNQGAGDLPSAPFIPLFTRLRVSFILGSSPEDYFAKAHGWEELVAAHVRWVELYNTQKHWAYPERKDARRSPSEVLGFLAGVRHRPEDLELAFFSTRFTRVLDASGSARLKHWRIYGEEGLARREVPLWLGPEVFTVEFAGDTLACFDVEYSSGSGTVTDGTRGHLREVKKPRLFATRHRSTQLRLFRLDAPGENGWLKTPKLVESMYLASSSSPLLCSRRFLLTPRCSSRSRSDTLGPSGPMGKGATGKE
jgi:hypothetical protein